MLNGYIDIYIKKSKNLWNNFCLLVKNRLLIKLKIHRSTLLFLRVIVNMILFSIAER